MRCSVEHDYNSRMFSSNFFFLMHRPCLILWPRLRQKILKREVSFTKYVAWECLITVDILSSEESRNVTSAEKSAARQ